MSENVDTATSSVREGAHISGTAEAKSATASTAPPEGSDKAPGPRPHEGPRDYDEWYSYGYPPIPGRMFGSGN